MDHPSSNARAWGWAVSNSNFLLTGSLLDNRWMTQALGSLSSCGNLNLVVVSWLHTGLNLTIAILSTEPVHGKPLFTQAVPISPHLCLSNKLSNYFRKKTSFLIHIVTCNLDENFSVFKTTSFFELESRAQHPKYECINISLFFREWISLTTVKKTVRQCY